MEARKRRWWAQEPIVDPYREADRLPSSAASSFMQVLVAEVLDDGIGTRPLIGRHDQVNITPTEAIERPVGHATGVDAQFS
jgi:hypothetical protein